MNFPHLLAYENANWRVQPLDFTVLDHHQGTLREWQAAIDEIHSRGIYVLLDVTGAT